MARVCSSARLDASLTPSQNDELLLCEATCPELKNIERSDDLRCDAWPRSQPVRRAISLVFGLSPMRLYVTVLFHEV